jgi:hypothetical protein
MDSQRAAYYVVEDLVQVVDREIIIGWNNRMEAKAL